MFRTLLLITASMLACASCSPKRASATKKLLVVTVTTGFRHSSIETAEQVIAEMAKKSGAFTVDFVHQPDGMPVNPGKAPERGPKDTDEVFAKKTADYSAALAAFNEANKTWGDKVKAHLAATMTPEQLKRYDGYIFANTTGDLPLPDRDALINEVESGKAFIAMHSGCDTYHGFPRYVAMLGGEFDGHPWHELVTMRIEDLNHPAGAVWTKPTDKVRDKFDIADEIYQYKSYNRADKHVIISLDPSNEETRPKKKDKDDSEKTFFQRGKRDDKDYAVSWTRDQGKGKVFYTSLGHREEVWLNPKYQAHILAGIKWALGIE
jgi:type 1 glutamine amidotransferase